MNKSSRCGENLMPKARKIQIMSLRYKFFRQNLKFPVIGANQTMSGLLSLNNEQQSRAETKLNSLPGAKWRLFNKFITLIRFNILRENFLTSLVSLFFHSAKKCFWTAVACKIVCPKIFFSLVFLLSIPILVMGNKGGYFLPIWWVRFDVC